MDREQSLNAVKSVIGGDKFEGKVDVIVESPYKTYLYSNIGVSIFYDAANEQMEVYVSWKDDSKGKPDFRELGLHQIYSTHFHSFSGQDRHLKWEDGANKLNAAF